MQVGNWSRCLNDLFGKNFNDNQHSSENDNGTRRSGDAKLKCFHLLNSLSDLLMLPKDLLMDRSIRKEVRSIKFNMILLYVSIIF